MPKETVFIEQDCTFYHDGKPYTAGGAIVTPDRIAAYPGDNGVLTDWHGRQIGTYRIVATWRNPRGIFSDTMHQIEATVDGIRYTGRGAGKGMLYRGKRKAA
jgi:hypothetical protein